MKKYGLLLGTLLMGSVAMTGCAKESKSIEAYKSIEADASPMNGGEGTSVETDNTAPTDNQAEKQNLTAGTTSNPEETPSIGNLIGDARNVTENQKTSNNNVTNKPMATKQPSTCTTAPVATKCPVATKAPVFTYAPIATKKPVVTYKPTATKTPTATKKPAADLNDGSSVSSNASKVLALVNEERAKQGLGALTTTTALNNAATKRAKEIVSSFSHTRPDGTSGVTVLAEYGISYRAWGENIAYGQQSASAVMNAWMNSDGHRANILSSKFGKVGIGCYEMNGTLYWTQVFTN